MSRFFFIGIGGIGMSALAELLWAQGHVVAGSDVSLSDSVTHLRKKGIAVYLDHPLSDFLRFRSEMVVVNNAISPQNPLWLEAQKIGCKILKRGELLAEFLNAKEGLAVSGSHGKTSTSSLLVYISRQLGKDPSFAIGGRFSDTGENAHLGSSNQFIAEGDESDASFLKLKPKVLGIVNIDADHMSTYQHSFELLLQHFADWVLNLPVSGTAVLNSDDPGTLAMLEKVKKVQADFWKTRHLVFVGKVLPQAYESDSSNFIQIRRIFPQESAIQVEFSSHDESYHETFPLRGEFNVRNALMAGAMAAALGLKWAEILQVLKTYPGVRRRMQYWGTFQSAPVFEDYGHHPTEIVASVQALKLAYPQRRVIQVFQLHRYTRTRDLWEDFLHALSLSDYVLLFPIYSASEDPISGISEVRFAEALRQKRGASVQIVTSVDQALEILEPLLKSSDLLLLQGAGDLPSLLREILIPRNVTMN